ncbi:dTDP-6-deoxy-L-talose 4-dehydrogenase (NAD(+)) [uncultured Leptotrichia sp.]|uniref:NAD-dependent epimerase/dehydratase family protein n=1 Tax=uncultured Leptotrichia sp. TaxID=159271 RepID=UPI001A53C5A7|nr:NAD(P)-dependent oxidoreductase [uncultured Leptotrichia sp.]VTX49131.1 dTDP-6-deoxy-L-talose 4-dehydrogenase (NAD(+)) [uncultured Leptotrichia sp.]
MNKQILVTGANGYIGKHVVEWLLDNNYDVLATDICLDRVDDRAQKKIINIFENSEDFLEVFKNVGVCIHLAWRNGFVHNSLTHLQDIPKHYEFLKKMSDIGIKNINVIGTMHEIGYWEGEITEKTPTNPISLYGIAKNSLRQSLMILRKNENIDLKWLRVYYIQGDDKNNNSIFAKILQKENEKADKFPFSTGKNKYDFISVYELAEMISKASLQTEIKGIINCCSGNPISLKEKVENFLRENNLKIKLEYGAFPDREYDSPAIWGNNDAILKILNK